MSRHNGRSGKNGIYNPRHNDRSFDVSNAENIKADQTSLNQYWDWKNGLRSHDQQVGLGEENSFKAIEKAFYEMQFGTYIAGQTLRNLKAGHAKRNRTVDDILADKRTCPEETVYQIGKEGDCPSPDKLLEVVTDFVDWYRESFGSHIQILDWALHLDETSPHIHMRQVYFVENSYGEIEPKQEKALEALGILLPEPEKKPGRTNNRKICFDAICREKLIAICEEHGLNVEKQAIYGGKAYLEKQDYIIENQRQKLEKQANELETLKAEKEAQSTEALRLRSENEILKKQLSLQKTEITKGEKQLTVLSEELSDRSALLADVDNVLEQIAGEAFTMAVAEITEKAVQETQQAHFAAIDRQKKVILSSDSSLKKSEKKLAENLLDALGQKLKAKADSILSKVREQMNLPEIHDRVVRKIREAIRPSLHALMRQLETQSRKRKENRRGEREGQAQRQDKQGIE